MSAQGTSRQDTTRQDATRNQTPEPAGHDAPDVERTVANQAKQAPPDGSAETKPDKGTRPGDLTTENDGGGEG